MFAVSDVLYITGSILLVHGGTHFLILTNDWSAVFTSSFFFFVDYKSSSTSSVHSRQIRWKKYQCTKERQTDLMHAVLFKCEKQPVLIRKNIKIDFVLQLWTRQRKSGYSIWGGAARWCVKPKNSRIFGYRITRIFHIERAYYRLMHAALANVRFSARLT